jgi:hypothetical protein
MSKKAMESSLLSRLEISLVNGELNELVELLISEGFSQLEIYDGYFKFCEKLRRENRETEEDYVTDLLDTIVGWCNPQHQHFSHYLTNEEIEEYQRQKYGGSSSAHM